MDAYFVHQVCFIKETAVSLKHYLFSVNFSVGFDAGITGAFMAVLALSINCRRMEFIPAVNGQQTGVVDPSHKKNKKPEKTPILKFKKKIPAGSLQAKQVCVSSHQNGKMLHCY